MNEQADRVRRERLTRGWSVRKASSKGGISNTFWGKFEDYQQPLTPFIQKAVADAYGWNDDWPDEGIEESGATFGTVAQIRGELASLGELFHLEMSSLMTEVTAMSASSVSRRDFENLRASVAELAQVVREELGVELALLLDDEESNATPDDPEPDEAAPPVS